MLKCSRANGKISERTSKRAGERQRQGGRVSESVLTKERACLHERQARLHRMRTRDQSEQGTVSEKREGGGKQEIFTKHAAITQVKGPIVSFV